MPLMTSKFYEITGLSPTRVYVETGVYLGEGIEEVKEHYKEIHAIELSDRWYTYNVEKFSGASNIHLHLGDSKTVLPKLLPLFNEPITIFLDAHFSGGSTAYGSEESPLLTELAILKTRPYDDIIVIDDCRLLGESGICGGPVDSIYPPMQFDWSSITETCIINLMRPNQTLLKNTKLELTSGQSDQIILAPINRRG